MSASSPDERGVLSSMGRARHWVGARFDWHDDSGLAGGAEVLPFGLLTFVIGSLLVMNLWGVIDTKMAVNAAARQGAHAVAEADSSATAAGSGREGAVLAMKAFGRTVDPKNAGSSRSPT